MSADIAYKLTGFINKMHRWLIYWIHIQRGNSFDTTISNVTGQSTRQPLVATGFDVLTNKQTFLLGGTSCLEITETYLEWLVFCFSCGDIMMNRRIKMLPDDEASTSGSQAERRLVWARVTDKFINNYLKALQWNGHSIPRIKETSECRKWLHYCLAWFTLGIMF